MIVRMVTALAKFIVEIGKGAWKALPVAGNWLDELIRWPFSLMLGGNVPRSTYEPDVTRSSIVDEFKKARQAAEIDVRRRDIVATVKKFCAAEKTQRDTMDLDGVDAGALALLLTMDDSELRTLSRANGPAIGRFCQGMPHGIAGVPAVGGQCPALTRGSPRPSIDHRNWTEQAELLSNVEGRFKIG